MLYFVEFICNGFSIKLVKIAQEVDLATCLASGATYESHMRRTEVEESNVKLHFTRHFTTQAKLQVTYKTL